MQKGGSSTSLSFKQKTSYESSSCLVGEEVSIGVREWEGGGRNTEGRLYAGSRDSEMGVGDSDSGVGGGGSQGRLGGGAS